MIEVGEKDSVQDVIHLFLIFVLGSFFFFFMYICHLTICFGFNVFAMALDCLRFDKENKKGVFGGYFLWLVLGYALGKFFCIMFVLMTC